MLRLMPALWAMLYRHHAKLQGHLLLLLTGGSGFGPGNDVDTPPAENHERCSSCRLCILAKGLRCMDALCMASFTHILCSFGRRNIIGMDQDLVKLHINLGTLANRHGIARPTLEHGLRRRVESQQSSTRRIEKVQGVEPQPRMELSDQAKSHCSCMGSSGV